ncbi:hypothetical protein [Paenibacillus oryzisoli]|uniref:Uncharacterized protein n=1 Tax=Paenibacillus oryzisoli TaxID=1850517 RepID=A0A197ZY71_9BACL|nr:hypothetical protein [Paenibacillus oryzisoli]OAS13945.1 hypothetical protein A8708_11230 [Paenibacillus oryzisoli]
MIQQRKMKRLLSRSALLLTAASFLTLPMATSAFAGKEGVFLSDSVYFTLDKVSLSVGAEDGSLRFSLGLNNNSNAIVDFNNYGVKVIDTNGITYTAKLNEKVVARVKAGETGTFKFTSEIPNNLTPSDLKVDIFRWNNNSTSDIGALSVESAMVESGQTLEQQAVINLKEIDTTLAEETLVTAKLGQSYKVYKDGVWMVYTDLILSNESNASVKLPEGLELNFQDSKGLTYGAQFVASVGALLPDQPVTVTLQAAVPASLDTNKLSLLFSPKGKVKTALLGTLNAAKTFSVARLGDKVTYPNKDDSGALNGLVMSTTWAAAIQQTDGLHVQANVTLTNTSDGIVSVPALTGEFQASRSNVGVTSSDNAVRSAYLSPNESTTFHFQGIIPASLNAEALQLVVLEKQGTTASTTTGTGTGSSSGSGTGAAGNNSDTPKQGTSLPVAVTSLAGAGVAGEATTYAAAQAYKIGDPFKLAATNSMDSNMDMSLVELGMSVNTDFGYKTVVAKYKLTNKSTTTLALPDFQTELTNEEGYTYTGVRQTNVAKNIAPNTSYVLNYSYMVPDTEDADKLALNLYDTNRLAMGSYKTEVQPIPATGPISVYPFTIDFDDYSLSATYNKDNSYSYRLRLDLDVQRQAQVITDANFSSLVFEVVDTEGRLLSSKPMTFTGQQRILSGVQFLEFNNIRSEQITSDSYFNIYEVITTPNGEAKRLIRTIRP